METYRYITRDESPDIKRSFEKCRDTIKSNKNNTCKHSIKAFQPLAVRFVRVTWMVSIIMSGLSLRGISIQFGIFQSVICGLSGRTDTPTTVRICKRKEIRDIRSEEAEIGSADSGVDNQN